MICREWMAAIENEVVKHLVGPELLGRSKKTGNLCRLPVFSDGRELIGGEIVGELGDDPAGESVGHGVDVIYNLVIAGNAGRIVPG